MALSPRQWIFLGVRVLLSLLIIAVLVRLEGAGLLLGLFLCCILAMLWAPLCAGLFAEVFHGIYSPSADSVELYREYSIAEARVKQGLYREAIAEFEKYKADDPKGLTPYLRIADILVAQFQDYPAAIEQLRGALAQTVSVDAFAHIQFRMADLLVKGNYDPRAALECLQAVQRKCHGTKYAAMAEERAKFLIDSMG